MGYRWSLQQNDEGGSLGKMGNIYNFLNEVPNQLGCVHVFYESCIINYSLSIELHIDIFSKLRKARHIFSKLQIGTYSL